MKNGMGGKLTYYAILGLLRDATQEEIRRAYLKSVQKLHPDKNVNPGETELFLDVQQAYEVLSNPARRSQYDATLPPEEQKIKYPVKLNILFSRKQLSRIDGAQLVYVLLDVAPEAEAAQSAGMPLNLCLVLDTSTSMKGEKLDVIKATANELISKLRPGDIFSVVTFNDRAEVLIPASRNADARQTRYRIQTMDAVGGTEIFHGLDTGLKEVRRYLRSNAVNHVILLTDGQTYGDEQQCLELAENAANDGIGISGLGIGNGWNDIFLDALANRTGGNCMYVSDPKKIQQAIMEKYEHLSQAFAEDVNLEFSINPGVELSYIFRLIPEAGSLQDQSPVKLGPIQSKSSLQVLMEFRIQPEAVKDHPDLLLFDGKLNIAMTSAIHPMPPMPVRMVRPVSDESDIEPPPPVIIQALSRLTMYRMQEKVRDEVQSGDYEHASQHLQQLATHLLARGERSLAKTVLLEAENIRKNQGFTEGGEKQIKYGTRALLLPGNT